VPHQGDQRTVGPLGFGFVDHGLARGDAVRLEQEVAAPQAGELAGDGVDLVGVLERVGVRLRVVLAGDDVVARMDLL
jgi:hypothetical protein